MPKFKYKAKDINNKVVRGVFFADDEADLRNIISHQDFYLISCSKIAESSQLFAFLEKIKTEEISFFCRQFSIMLTSGMEISKAVELLRDSTKIKKLKDILEVVYNDLMQGKMLSESFAKYPKTFPVFFRNMIAIGEASGKLDKVLMDLADYYDNDVRIKRKVKSALSYPLFLICIAFAVLFAISFFIMPVFSEVFESFGSELPDISVKVIAVSNFLKENFGGIILGIILLYLIIKLLGKSTEVAKLYDKLKLHAPVFGGVVNAMITSRFASGFALLLNSGIPVVDSIDTISKLLGNRIVEEKLKQTSNEVKAGGGIAKSISMVGLFPSLLTEMISVGERTGSLEEVLNKTTAYYDEQVEYSIKKMTSVIEPLMIFLVAGIVIIVLLAVFLPMLDLMSAIDSAGV